MRLFSFKVSFPLTIVTILTILNFQPTQAASAGQAFRDTFSAPSFSYDASADLKISKGVNSAPPFDFQMSVKDQGGKSDGNLGKTGEMNLNFNNLGDMPPSFADLHNVSANFKYRAEVMQAGGVQFAEITDANVTSDSPSVSKITEMMNQLAKFITGRSFRFSGEEIANMIKTETGSSPSMANSQEFLTMLTAGKSIDQVTAAFGTLIDDLVTSGVLVDDVTSTSGVRSSRNNMSGNMETHHLHFGSTISVDGAKQFDQAFMTFVQSIFPGMVGDAMSTQMQSSPTMATKLNAFLQKANQAGFDLTFDLNNGLLSKLSLQVDLNAIGMPMTFNEVANFDYNTPYVVSIPQDQKTIIDLNKIVEGVMAIASLSTPSPEPMVQPNIESSGAHPGVPELYANIQLVCPDYADGKCARKEARKQLTLVRNQYTSKDFATLRRELNALINQYYQ